MVGDKLSHYRIVEQIGAGGMGERNLLFVPTVLPTASRESFARQGKELRGYLAQRAEVSIFSWKNSRPSGATDQEIVALFRWDLDPTVEKAESTLVTIGPGSATGELALTQLEQSADRPAAILEKGDRLQKTYIWKMELNP